MLSTLSPYLQVAAVLTANGHITAATSRVTLVRANGRCRPPSPPEKSCPFPGGDSVLRLIRGSFGSSESLRKTAYGLVQSVLLAEPMVVTNKQMHIQTMRHLKQ